MFMKFFIILYTQGEDCLGILHTCLLLHLAQFYTLTTLLLLEYWTSDIDGV